MSTVPVIGCKHQAFSATFNTVYMQMRDGDTPVAWRVELTVTCRTCKVPMRFLHVPVGIDVTKGAVVSPELTELRVLMAPAENVVPYLVLPGNETPN